MNKFIVKCTIIGTIKQGTKTGDGS